MLINAASSSSSNTTTATNTTVADGNSATSAAADKGVRDLVTKYEKSPAINKLTSTLSIEPSTANNAASLFIEEHLTTAAVPVQQQPLTVPVMPLRRKSASALFNEEANPIMKLINKYEYIITAFFTIKFTKTDPICIFSLFLKIFKV